MTNGAAFLHPNTSRYFFFSLMFYGIRLNDLSSRAISLAWWCGLALWACTYPKVCIFKLWLFFFFLSGYFFLLTFIYCSQSSGRCLGSIKIFGSLDNFWRLDKDDKDHLKNPICAFVSSTGTGLSHIRTDEFEYTIDSILSIFSSRSRLPL